MAQNSKIEWTDTTWNVLAGCDKVSDGCKNCYAMQQAHIRAGNPNLKVKAAYEGTTTKPEGGRVNWTGKVNLLADRLEQPLHWKKPRKVFVNAMSDLFHEDVPFEFIHKIEAISASTKHTYQILTKRPQRALEYFHEYRKMKAPLNWWLGVSVEDQKTADERIPLLLQIPAAVRFLSCEPLLGEINLKSIECERAYGSYWLNALTGKARDWHDVPFKIVSTGKIDWVICGGESGHGARPMNSEWAKKIRDDCKSAGVPYFFKQFGDWVTADDMPEQYYKQLRSNTGKKWKIANFQLPDDNRIFTFHHLGKKAAGRLLDGVEHNEMPK